MRTILATTILAIMAAGLTAQETATKPATGPQEELLFDFEPGGKLFFDQAEGAQFVDQHVTQGKNSWKLPVEKGKESMFSFGFWRGTNMAGKWGQFDRFITDVFVEGGAVKVYCIIRDDQGTGWNERYNVDFQLQPGKRRIEIPIASITRQKNQKPLNIDKLTTVGLVFSLAKDDEPATLYLDNSRLTKGGGAFAVKTLFSFEGADKGKYVLEDWPEEFKGKSKLEVSDQHASDGKKSIRLESHADAGNVQLLMADEDANWSDFDTLAFDVFNPDDQPVIIGGWIKNKPADGYYDRYSWERVMRPGFNCLRLPIAGMAFPSGRKNLDASSVYGMNISLGHKTIFIDNVRLIKGTEEIAVEGLKKFDFGPKGGVVMPGFTGVSKDSAYNKSAGFGWLPRGEFGRDFDIREVMNRHSAFDDLVRDSCNPVKAQFAVDVPNGEYQVWLMMNAPGGTVWFRHFKHRSVTLNGKTILDQQYDAESFKKVEFLWQDAEDLPGDDLWERYVNTAYKPELVDVTVTDGQIVLGFDGYGAQFQSLVCGLAVWPKAQSQQATKWLAALAAARKEQYLNVLVEQPPKAVQITASDDDMKKGFVRFVHSPDAAVEVNTVPAKDAQVARAIDMAAAPGEYEDGCFAVAPLKDCGKATAAVSGLKGPGGSVIDGKALNLQVVRYKAINHGPTYQIEPRYLDIVPADGVDLKKGVTRSFWLVVKVPADAKAGKYEGTIQLSIAGQAVDTVPVSLTVWPIKLSQPEIPIGMFCVTPQYEYLSLAGDKESYWQAWKELIDDYREHGMTSFDPAISAPITAVKDGKAIIDFAAMDRWMDMAKAAGFTKELLGYATGTGFPLRPQATDDGSGDKAAQAFGLKDYAELVKVYFAAFKEHAKEKGYLPICFASDDEYLIHPGSTIEGCAKFHKILKENAPGFRFVALDSISPDEKPELIPQWTDMLKQVDTWGAGLHSPKMSEVLGKAGSRLWLYNTGMDRFTFGTYMFWAHHKNGVQGFFQWIYPSSGTLSAYDLLSHIEGNFGVVVPSSRGLRPTLAWERIRAGCNDHRYLQTAWDLIAANKTGPKAADAKALQEVIDQKLGKLYFGASGNAADGQRIIVNPMDAAGMESFRRSVAEGILRLQSQ